MIDPSKSTVLRAGLAALALAVAPALAAAQGGEVGSLKLGGSIGLFASSFDTTGVQLRLDGTYTFSELQPRLYLEGAGHLAAMFGSNDVSVWEAVPKARLRYALSDQLSVYGDVGLGLAILHVSIPDIFGGGSENTLSAIIRFAGGVLYAIRPDKIWLTLEPVGINVYTASGSGFAYTLLAGVLVRL